jgi:hypothetical protein
LAQLRGQPVSLAALRVRLVSLPLAELPVVSLQAKRVPMVSGSACPYPVCRSRFLTLSTLVTRSGAAMDVPDFRVWLTIHPKWVES